EMRIRKPYFCKNTCLYMKVPKTLGPGVPWPGRHLYLFTDRWFLLIFVSFFSVREATGQWFASFTESSLEQWEGDTLHFQITPDQMLQLNAPKGLSHSTLRRKV